MRQDIVQAISSGKALILDGGQGTQLEARGLDISGPMWSTVPFMDERFWDFDRPNAAREAIRAMYRDFIASGSNILSTITYQASYKTLHDRTAQIGSPREYDQFLQKIVQFCRQCVSDDLYLVGSIGTYAAYVQAEYTGKYRSIDFLKYFQPQIDSFNKNSEIDIIGFETVPNLAELEAILSWDESIISKSFYISLSVGDNMKLRDGSTLEQVAAAYQQRSAQNSNLLMLGFNCVPFAQAADIVSRFHSLLPDMKLICYPNSGEIYDTNTQTWHSDGTDGSSSSQLWADFSHVCQDNNVKVIGGCCRTTPADILAIATAMSRT